MDPVRRMTTFGTLAVLALTTVPFRAAAQPGPGAPREMIVNWYRLILELVRHTPTYSPPVASRSFAYVGITAYEAIASGPEELLTLAGQVNGLTPVPDREPGAAYDEAVVLQAALAAAVRAFFFNTGPTGQRAMGAMEAKLRAKAATGVAPDVVARSEAHGAAVAAHILAWAESDGGAVVENLGFPYEYAAPEGPDKWVPTSLVALQQRPLLPAWGGNRTFAMPSGTSCGLPPPPAYSEEPGSEFHAEALEVYEVSKSLTKEQKAIARFWSDDPMLSSTPPGHWGDIAMQLVQSEDLGIGDSVDLLARLGIAVADAFIGCWQTKYEFNLLRPVTYIRRTIDPKWESLLNTPPFPEYPSGHSTQSGAAAEVLTAFFGEDFAFEDRTHEDDGLPARTFPSFHAAAEEAGLSRLYGGIHFRSGIVRGLEQGRCIGAYANALKTRG